MKPTIQRLNIISTRQTPCSILPYTIVYREFTWDSDHHIIDWYCHRLRNWEKIGNNKQLLEHISPFLII